MTGGDLEEMGRLMRKEEGGGGMELLPGRTVVVIVAVKSIGGRTLMGIWSKLGRFIESAGS